MGQPVKLSDELIRDARSASELSERSIDSQIEFWARLGQAIEPLLRGDRALALRRASAGRPLTATIDQVDTDEGRRRITDYLGTRPFPHFEPVSGSPGSLVKIDEDGTRTVGRFINRVFVADEACDRG